MTRTKDSAISSTCKKLIDPMYGLTLKAQIHTLKVLKGQEYT